VYLSRLALTNFRNFRSLELSLPAGMVLLMGANAQGKSNLLEAAYLLAIAKSYRATSERELVHWEAFEEADSTGPGQGLITGEVELKGGHLHESNEKEEPTRRFGFHLIGSPARRTRL